MSKVLDFQFDFFNLILKRGSDFLFIRNSFLYLVKILHQ